MYDDIEFKINAKQVGFRDYKRDGYFCRAYEFMIPSDELNDMKSKILKGLQSLSTLKTQDWDDFSKSSTQPVCYNTIEETISSLLNFIQIGLSDPGDYRMSINELVFACEFNIGTPPSLRLTVLREYYGGSSDCTFYWIVRSEEDKYKISIRG